MGEINPNDLKLRGNTCLVEAMEQDNKTRGGIIIPEAAGRPKKLRAAVFVQAGPEAPEDLRGQRNGVGVLLHGYSRPQARFKYANKSYEVYSGEDVVGVSRD